MDSRRRDIFRTTIWEIAILFLIVAIFVLGCIGTFLPYSIPTFCIIKINDADYFSHFNNLFSIQASTSTLCITLIALLSHIFGKEYYGKNVAKYVMDEKPKLLKLKVIIILEVALLLVSYVFLSMLLLNLLISLFVISIVLNIYMIMSIYQVVVSSSIQEEIKNSLLLKLKHIDYTKSKNQRFILENTLLLIANLQSMDIINKSDVWLDNATQLIEVIRRVSNPSNKSNNYLNEVQKDVLLVISYTFKNGNADQVFKVYELMYVMYKQCNEFNEIIANNNDKINLTLFDDIYYEFGKSLSRFNWKEIFSKDTLINLTLELFRNINYSQNENRPQNAYLLYSYIAHCYMSIFVNNKNNANAPLMAKNTLYFVVKHLIREEKKNPYSGIKLSVLNRNIVSYFRLLICEHDKENLEATYVNDYCDYFNQNSTHETKTLFCILIYLYYLSECEELASDTDKDFAKHFLANNKNKICDKMYDDNTILLNTEYIESIYSIISNWELMKPNEAKRVIMGFVIDKFFVYYLLEKNYISNTKEILKNIIRENYSGFYEIYFGSSNLKRTQQEYFRFLQLFYDDKLTWDDCCLRINDFKEIFIALYKEHEIHYNNMVDSSHFTIGVKHIAERIFANNNLFNACETAKKNKSFSIDIFEVIDNSFINSNLSIIQYFENDLRITYIDKLLDCFVNNIKINTVQKNQLDILGTLYDEANNNNVNIDTIIGFRKHLRDKNIKKFMLSQEKCVIIKSPKHQNYNIFVDSKKMFFDVKECNVSIAPLTDDEILSHVKKDNDKYLAHITNSIYLPFGKEEVLDYFKKTKSKVVLDMKIEYGVTEDIVGIGVKIT